MGDFIRPWAMENAADMASAMNNKNVQNNLRDGIPFPYTVADAENYIRSLLNGENENRYAFAIIFNNKVVGSIGVTRNENIHRRTAELGYYVAEPYWGKGIATNAVKEVCEYIFENTDIVRVFAEPFSYNTASCRVLEKAGFSFEGTLRKNAIKNGKILDMKMYALIKETE